MSATEQAHNADLLRTKWLCLECEPEAYRRRAIHKISRLIHEFDAELVSITDAPKEVKLPLITIVKIHCNARGCGVTGVFKFWTNQEQELTNLKETIARPRCPSCKSGQVSLEIEESDDERINGRKVKENEAKQGRPSRKARKVAPAATPHPVWPAELVQRIDILRGVEPIRQRLVDQQRHVNSVARQAGCGDRFDAAE